MPLERACKLLGEVVRVSFELDPLLPVAGWAMDRLNAANTVLAVAKGPLLAVEGPVLAFSAALSPLADRAQRMLRYIILSPAAELLSDQELRSVLAHELLHAAGVLDEDEVEERVSEAVKLRPDLFATLEKAMARLVEEAKRWKPEEVVPLSWLQEGREVRAIAPLYPHSSVRRIIAASRLALECIGYEPVKAGGGAAEAETGEKAGEEEKEEEEEGGAAEEKGEERVEVAEEVEKEGGKGKKEREEKEERREARGRPVRARLWTLARQAVDAALREVGLRYFWQMRVDGMAEDVYEKYLRALERELAKLSTVHIAFKPEKLPQGGYGPTRVYVAGTLYGTWEPHQAHKIVGAFWNWVHRVYNLLLHLHENGWLKPGVVEG
ncbi:MAG: hypothetical protein QXT28_06215 [Thermofilaceae archaeon]